MKRQIVLIVGCSFLIHLSFAQTGDLSLPPLPARLSVKTFADSGLVGNGFKWFLVGKNYRHEWTSTIRVPVLNLKTDFGGLKPEKEGGGKETRHLHLKDSNGVDWSLRSVRKFAEGLLAPELKGTIAQTLITDGISASYPYGVLSVGTLATATGVPFHPNTVVYIPDDTSLGAFRSKFKNTLALLEKGKDKDAKEDDTEEMILKLMKNNKRLVDQQALLRARLLDNFIMDFDRHEGQWSWKEKDSAGRTYYQPIPKDRDQAFFKGEGFLVKKLSKIPSLGQIQGLKARPKNIYTFNWAPRNIDNAFLNELNEATWSSEVDHFLSAATDSVIVSALHKQPSEIQKYHVDHIIKVLEEKKLGFKEDMLKYYRFLSKTVMVVGTNDADLFSITKNADGSMELIVRDLKDSSLTYSRLFDPAVTKEVRVYGLEGDDRFVINGQRSPIKLRLVGGPGGDVFTNSAEGGKVRVYDVSFEHNTLHGKGLKKRISPDPLNNEYRRINDYYNSSSVGIKPEYEKDGGGLFLGLRFAATTPGFRKEPFATKHVAYLTKSLSSSGWHAHYDVQFISIARKTDLVFTSDAELPTMRSNFFGYGNNTQTNNHINEKYYRIQYNLVEASLMARHPLSSSFQVNWGPVMQYFNIQPEKNEGHYIGSLPNSTTGDLYGGRWYAGGELRATVNTKNSEVIATRGIYFTTYARGWKGLSQSPKTFSQLGTQFNFYTDFLKKKRIVLASSFGADRNFGGFEIPQAQYLGFKQNLRGYRYQRFAGMARVYNNEELRVNLGELNLYLFKGPIGILAFHDVGRVWVSGEDSNRWHTGYGGGVWLAPFRKLVLTGMLTSSKEVDLFPMVIFGFQF